MSPSSTAGGSFRAIQPAARALVPELRLFAFNHFRHEVLVSFGRIAGLTATVAAGWFGPAQAQGVELSLAVGVSGAPAELASRRPDFGIGLEVQPQWRFGSGVSLGAGVRYTTYPYVPDRESVYLDFRFTARGPRARPVIGVRAGGFHGGDTENDDPYLGLEIGPVGGVEVPLSEGLGLQVLGSAYGVLALFRGFRVLPGLQVGLVLR